MLEKTLESPLDCKDIQPVHPKGNQSWIFIGRTDAEAETPILRLPDAKKSDSLEKTLMLGKIEGRRRRGDWGWDGWMASLTQWRWVWTSSESWWWTVKPGVLQSMGSQRVRHDWVTELNCTERLWIKPKPTTLTLYILFFPVKTFWWPWRGPEQTSLLFLNSMRVQSHGTSNGPLCPSASLASPSNSISLSNLVDPEFYSVKVKEVPESDLSRIWNS